MSDEKRNIMILLGSQYMSMFIPGSQLAVAFILWIYWAPKFPRLCKMGIDILDYQITVVLYSAVAIFVMVFVQTLNQSVNLGLAVSIVEFLIVLPIAISLLFVAFVVPALAVHAELNNKEFNYRTPKLFTRFLNQVAAHITRSM